MLLHFGYHIIKRISKNTCTFSADQKTLDELKEKIKADPRVAVSRKQMLQTILKQTQFREFIPPETFYGTIQIVCFKIKNLLRMRALMISLFCFSFQIKNIR